MFGMAGMGTLVGIFVAWSSSPILNTLLPLIFGLVGGASGLSILRLDITSEKDALKLALIGRTLGAFSLSCVLAIAVGLLLRPALRWYDRGDFQAEKLDSQAGKLDLNDLILRRKLRALGANSDEIARTLSLFHLSQTDKAALESDINDLSDAVNKFTMAFEKTGQNAPAFSSNDSIEGLYLIAKGLQPYLSSDFQHFSKLQPEIANAQILKHLAPLANLDFAAVLSSGGIADKNLLSNTEFITAVVSLESRLERNQLVMRAGIGKKIDDALGAAGQLPTSTESSGGGGGDGGGALFGGTRPWNIFPAPLQMQ